MNCGYGTKLDRYADSEMPAGELAEFETHLRTCPDCAAGALDRLRWKRAIQAAGRRFSSTPEFRLKVERSVRPERSGAWTWRWAPALAAAAAVAVTLTSAAVWTRQDRSDQTLSELADLHISSLASSNPIDVASSDRHTVKPWFQGKLPFTFNLPELEHSPFQLAGGRLAYFRQNPGAQLLFTAGRHRISAFLFQDRAELSRLKPGAAPHGDFTFTSETWAEGGLRYFVIGDAGVGDIRALAALLKSAASP